jgi:hypothetical protein
MLRSPGSRNQAASCRPRTGKAAAQRAANRAIRRRAVRVSPTIRRRDTVRTGRPRSRATTGATRAFRSSPYTVPPASGTTDFTSPTRRAAVGRW